MKNKTLEPLPFEEAIAFFEDKIGMSMAEFKALSDAAKAQAFTVSRVTNMDIIMDVYHAVENAIAEGETLIMFKDRIADIMSARGWEGLAPWHLETIFRDNTQTAYQAGRYGQMLEQKERFPYWEYDAVNDSRTRPSHGALDGKVYPANHEFWNTWYPPNGHNCRCSVNPVNTYIVDAEKLKIDTQSPPGSPDPGWDHNPAKEPWEPNLKKYPEELRKQFKKEKGGR